MECFSLSFAIKAIISGIGIIILVWGVGDLVKQALENYFKPLNFNENEDEDESNIHPII